MEWTVMAIIWGGLMLYFITPFSKTAAVPQYITTMRQAVKLSLKRVTFHRKAVLAVVLLMTTYLAIWYSTKDLAWYNEAHGVYSSADPAEKVPLYLAGVTVYALMLYSTAVGRQAFSYLKKGE